jgi:hypothetical protein
MSKTFFTYNAALMSPRTAKYVEAMIREGDSFDYDEWLKKVREEDAQAKQSEVTGLSGELAPAEIDKPMSSPGDQHARPNPSVGPLTTKAIWVPRVLRRPHCQAKSRTPKVRLRRWLEKVRRAWGDFQASRRRDAVYGYLEAVFAIVMHYKVRRRATKLLQHAFEFAHLPIDKDADAFSAVIRCTSGRNIDTKTISKWSRALRYVARRKEPDIELSTFMKEAGGVNACADGYTRLTRHS